LAIKRNKNFQQRRGVGGEKGQQPIANFFTLTHMPRHGAKPNKNICQQPTANSQQPTANSQQPTANS
jgi:hypothetical protein